jgi:hypothetical protein
MKIRNESTAYGLLAGLLVLLLGVIVNSGCGPRVPPVGFSPFNIDHDKSSVLVWTNCGYGTGALIDETHVITAHHVVDCDQGVPHHAQLATVVIIETLGGTKVTATFDALDESRDLARLKLESPVSGAPTLTFAHAVLGETLCAVTATPERGVKCGVYDATHSRYEGDLNLAGMAPWFGNSGSPLYNNAGQMVGTLVRMAWCSPWDEFMYRWFGVRSETCGGRGTSLHDSAVMP